MLPKSADRGRRGGGAPVDGVDGWAGREGAHLGEHVGEGWEGRGWAWGEWGMLGPPPPPPPDLLRVLI